MSLGYILPNSGLPGAVRMAEWRLNKDTTKLGGFNVKIAPKMAQSFFIYVNASVMIQKTATVGQPFEQDEDIIIHSGANLITSWVLVS